MVGARKADSKPREQAKRGTHAARLIGITDLGHQPEWFWQGKKIDDAWKVEFTYELVDHLMEDGRPFLVSEELTNKDWEDTKTGKSTTLVARAKSILGEDYRKGVDNFQELLSGACMISIVPKESGYMKVDGQAGVGSVPFGMTVKEATNDSYLFHMDSPDMDLWEAMPDFKKEKIQKALNYSESSLARELAAGDAYA